MMLRIKKLAAQFMKFGMVGASNTLISLACYYGFLALGCHYLVGNTIGFLASVVNAFYWNNRLVFKEKQETSMVRAFIKVFLSYLGSFLLSTALIWIMVELLHISDKIAPILRLLVTIPLNFILNKLWAFRDKT